MIYLYLYLYIYLILISPLALAVPKLKIMGSMLMMLWCISLLLPLCTLPPTYPRSALAALYAREWKRKAGNVSHYSMELLKR